MAIALALLLAATLQASRFAPPAEQLANPARLGVLKLEVDDGNPVDAAARIEALLVEGETALIPTEHGLLALWAWVDALPAGKAAAMRDAAPPAVQSAAKRAMDALLRRDRVEPHEFVQLARRYPFTRLTAELYAHAARRYAVLADRSSARAMYARALTMGFAPDPDERRLIDSLASTDKTPPAAPGATALAFAAPWFDGRNPYELRRVVPIDAKGLIILAGPGHVIAAEPRGTIKWVWSYTDFAMQQNGKAPDPKLSEAVLNRSRRVRYEPAVVDDGTGSVARVIVRQPSIRRTDQFAIRSIDASGQLAWATDSSDALDSLNFCSTPVIAGRHVYVVAQLRVDRQPEKLLLVALDVMTGARLWECDLGPLVERAISSRVRDRESPGEYNDLWADQSAVGVDDENVYISPGGGTLVAVERFAGAVRWHGFYEEFVSVPTDKKRISDLRKGANQRFTNTPVVIGEQVIVVPRDSAMAVSFDRGTGAPRWSVDVPAGQSLVGATEEIAVLVRGPEMTGLRTTDGTVAWSYRGEARSRPTGPALIAGDQVVFMTSSGLAAINARTGQPLPPPSGRSPTFAPLLDAAPIRAALGQAGLLESFMVSGSPSEQERRNR